MVEVRGLKISPELFETGMDDGNGPCRCGAACCLGGVYADVMEKERILDHDDIIRKYMDETQTQDVARWFEDHEHADNDFPSGRCVGTSEVNDKCVFLDKEGRCTLQVAAVGEGMDRWFLKPLYCILYPIEVTDGVLRFDDLLQGDESCCSVKTDFQVPLFEVCREELTHVLGEDGFQKLREHYAARFGSGGKKRELP